MEGVALLEIVHGQMYYSNKQLAEAFGVSLGTVHRRKIGIERYIQMAKINTEYDVGSAFEAIEEELISSMIRNMERHKLEEIEEDKQWSMWQAEQLKALEKYRKQNKKKFGKEFKEINKKIDRLILGANEDGQMDQEAEILKAIKKGFPAKKVSRGGTAEFFKVNDRKLNALLEATSSDMQKAESAVLRRANDQYRKLDSKTDSSTPLNRNAVPPTDFGSLAQGDTVIDKTDKKMQGLINRCKELADLFKKGFQIGFGDSDKKIDSINTSIKNIGKNLKEIFTDPAIVRAANECANSIALAFGKITGSFTRIGLTIADNLIGGVDKYLEKSKDYIKKNLISIFDVTGEIADLSGNFAVAIADIFDVFSSDDAKGITADIIGIFADGYLGATTVGLKFVRDIEKLIVTPVTQNVDKIKTAFENILLPIRIVMDTIHQSVKDTFTKINAVYDKHIAPFSDSIAQGISEIVGTLLDGFNTYVAPVLQGLATDFDGTWKDSVQPALNGIIELLGSVFDLLKVLWENLLQPILNWAVKNAMPIIASLIKNTGDDFNWVLGVISGVISETAKLLKGLIDFLTGVFSGDWKKAFSGLKEIADSFKMSFKAAWKYIKDGVLGGTLAHIKTVFSPAWNGFFKDFKSVAEGFKTKLKNVFSSGQTYFNGIITFVNNKFLGKWKKAWKNIRDTFSDVFGALGSLAKKPINAIISAFNSVIKTINALITKINSIKFTIDIPDWIPGFGGSSWGFSGFSIPKMSYVPALAQGAYVKPNTPQLAMIGDNMHQGEFVAPEDKLKEMAKQAVREAGGSGVTKEELESIVNRAVMRIVTALAEMGFYIDSEQVGRATQAARTAADRRFNAVEVG